MDDSTPEDIVADTALGEPAEDTPEITFVPGHTLTQKYRYDGDHIVMTVSGESFNVGFRPKRQTLRNDRSKYTPHQGARECARRMNQWGV